MKVGDLVWFPCESERYKARMGVYLGKHDNHADVNDPVLSRRMKENGQPPRQVADILYDGKHVTCWHQHVRAAEIDHV